ncbi:unnamed protein product [Bursaphelenchus okinawaensis]|uniref:Uncharacterized protein n=1 Tax=Bursaphelenchus okinawaensis TaxID=465554 RepID=A0A811JPP2_9BILA|nr:unnamed protein product [Bursaphelenchus okinawaensis]CAG9076839.1 unnamed protein product [Bursaphelenchus okinawaensis]
MGTSQDMGMGHGMGLDIGMGMRFPEVSSLDVSSRTFENSKDCFRIFVSVLEPSSRTACRVLPENSGLWGQGPPPSRIFETIEVQVIRHRPSAGQLVYKELFLASFLIHNKCASRNLVQVMSFERGFKSGHSRTNKFNCWAYAYFIRINDPYRHKRPV